MTLSAFAVLRPATENPKAITTAVTHETNELRISVPIRAQGKGAVTAYCEQSRSAKPIYPVFSSFLSRQPAGIIHRSRSRAGSLLATNMRNRVGFPFGRAAWRGAQILFWPRRDLLKLSRRVHRPVGIAQHLAREQH
jgi:hypothetical protein